MDQVTFTPADAQRISNAVIAYEKSKTHPQEMDWSMDEDQPWVIVQITGPGGLNNNYPCIAKRWVLSGTAGSTQNVSNAAVPGMLHDINNQFLSQNKNYLAKYHGTITVSGVVYPYYLTGFVAASSGQSLDVVVDVLCDPQSGIQVEKAAIGTITDTLVYRSFTSLLDCPNSYAGHGGQVLKVNANGTGLEFASVAGVTGGAVVFPDLSDVPQSYKGAGLFAVGVKSTENGLSYIPPTVDTQYSIKGGGNLLNRTGTKLGNYEAYTKLQLVGDVETPGKDMVYGTNSKGERGWVSVGSNVKTISITTDAGVLDVTGSPAAGNNPSIKVTLFDHGVKDKEYGGIDGATGKPKVPLLSINKYGIVYEASESDLMALQKLTIKSNKGLDVTDGVVVPNAGNSYEGTVTIELKQQGTINKINTSNNYIDGTSLATVESTTETIVNTLVSKVNEIVQMLKDMGASA